MATVGDVLYFSVCPFTIRIVCSRDIKIKPERVILILTVFTVLDFNSCTKFLLFFNFELFSFNRANLKKKKKLVRCNRK